MLLTSEEEIRSQSAVDKSSKCSETQKKLLHPLTPPRVPLTTVKVIGFVQQRRLYSSSSWPQRQEEEVKQFHMASVFRTQTCVMVTSPGSGTSHPNTLPPG